MTVPVSCSLLFKVLNKSVKKAGHYAHHAWPRRAVKRVVKVAVSKPALVGIVCTVGLGTTVHQMLGALPPSPPPEAPPATVRPSIQPRNYFYQPFSVQPFDSTSGITPDTLRASFWFDFPGLDTPTETSSTTPMAVMEPSSLLLLAGAIAGLLLMHGESPMGMTLPPRRRIPPPSTNVFDGISDCWRHPDHQSDSDDKLKLVTAGAIISVGAATLWIAIAIIAGLGLRALGVI
jgi:hypothetical protein